MMDCPVAPVLRSTRYGALLDDVMRSKLLDLAPLVTGPQNDKQWLMANKTVACMAAFAYVVAANYPELLNQTHLSVALVAKPSSELTHAPWYLLKLLWGRDIHVSMTLLMDAPADGNGYDPGSFQAVVSRDYLPVWLKTNTYDLVFEAFAELPAIHKAAITHAGTPVISELVRLSTQDIEPLPINVTRMTRYSLEIGLTHSTVAVTDDIPAVESWRWEMGHRRDVTTDVAIALVDELLKGNGPPEGLRTNHG